MIRRLLAPRMLVLHALAIVATVAAALLGLWQYDAWEHAREDQSASRVDDRPVPLDSVMTSDQAFPVEGLGRPVAFSGRWVGSGTVYVAGKQLRGRDGVWAVTPVEVCGPSAPEADCEGAPAMLVVRGWAPSAQRAPAPPAGRVAVTGWLQPGEGSGGSSGETDAGDGPGDDVVAALRIAEAIQHVEQDLYGGFVIAEKVSTTPATGAGSPTGERLEPVTPAALPEPDAFTSLRNLLYALEWWVFGGFAVFLWWRWCRDEVAGVAGVPSTA